MSKAAFLLLRATIPYLICVVVYLTLVYFGLIGEVR